MKRSWYGTVHGILVCLYTVIYGITLLNYSSTVDNDDGGFWDVMGWQTAPKIGIGIAYHALRTGGSPNLGRGLLPS